MKTYRVLCSKDVENTGYEHCTMMWEHDGFAEDGAEWLAVEVIEGREGMFERLLDTDNAVVEWTKSEAVKLPIATAETIRSLNTQAQRLSDDGMRPYDAVRMAASQGMLTLIEDDGENCILYITSKGEFVNCWAYPNNGIEDRILDGGMGFDDQVEWYTEREAEYE